MIAKKDLRPKTCDYCQKVLHGRSDQHFCNDTCRNTFNRNRRAAEKIEEHANTPEIFRVIKQNYQLLKKHCLGALEDNAFLTINKASLIEKGFNPRFFTSTCTDKDNGEWKCVFEIGFIMGREEIYIRDFPDQVQL